MAGEAPTWERVVRYHRRAEVLAVDRLTPTGTVKITLAIADGQPFDFSPGYWVGIEAEIKGAGPRRSPYCIFSPPSDDRRFEILLRVFPEGPLAHHLASLQPGDQLAFRGPSGRSMLPKEPGSELIMLATGVGISPFYSLCHHLLAHGDRRPLRVFWGLRLTDDICLERELDGLAARHHNFRYQISLSQPPSRWPQLRGRVTESVPPLLDTLGGKHFLLSGNGAMVEEMEVALSSLGVDRSFIHGEKFFNVRHRPDPSTIDAILGRFVASDRQAANTLLDQELIFPLHRDVHGRVVGPPDS
ncbi:MAG: FAD-binding oxidoreductase [Actinomycetota bacterium]|nr:FAD-binding oxidoreductase [Actinomycetota bacterium]